MEGSPDKAEKAHVTDLSARLATARSEEEVEDTLRLIADEANVSPATLRLALNALRERQERRTFGAWVSHQISQIDFATRRVLTSCLLLMGISLIEAAKLQGDRYGIGTIGQIVLGVLAVWNLAVTRKSELGMLTGAVGAAAYVAGLSIFSWVLRVNADLEGESIVPATLIGGVVGFVVGRFGDRLLQLRFQHDPEKRRESLLRQLIELQDELRVEQIATFLSVDVVGSTPIKQGCDPLSAEYTFGEYTNYVTGITGQFGGALHSTAGDGILLTFEHPREAFLAARRIQAGMLEFNTFRNRTGTPFSLRVGIHTGTVVTPGKGLKSVAYSPVIDVAVHVQKASPPGGIAITEDAAMYVPGGPEAISSTRIDVQGCKTLVWAGHGQPVNPTEQQLPPPLPPFQP